jgi:quinol monooxygenase YgiN
MIKRLVKLTFRPDAVDEFIREIFDQMQSAIRNFPGCQHLELLKDVHQPHILFTLSIWENEEALDAYRQSALFQQTWVRTKALFAEKAEAWTLNIHTT